MCTLDMKDVYLSVSVSLEDRKYLCSIWDGRMYEFTYLPLCSTSCTFTKLRPAIAIHYHQLQQVKIRPFRRSRSFDTQVTLDQKAREELQWWRDQRETCNGKGIIIPPLPSMVIKTDASTVGWGVVCQVSGPEDLDHNKSNVNISLS